MVPYTDGHLSNVDYGQNLKHLHFNVKISERHEYHQELFFLHVNGQQNKAVVIVLDRPQMYSNCLQNGLIQSKLFIPTLDITTKFVITN